MFQTTERRPPQGPCAVILPLSHYVRVLESQKRTKPRRVAHQKAELEVAGSIPLGDVSFFLSSFHVKINLFMRLFWFIGLRSFVM